MQTEQKASDHLQQKSQQLPDETTVVTSPDRVVGDPRCRGHVTCECKIREMKIKTGHRFGDPLTMKQRASCFTRHYPVTHVHGATGWC